MCFIIISPYIFGEYDTDETNVRENKKKSNHQSVLVTRF